jgi:hypothetical protein
VVLKLAFTGPTSIAVFKVLGPKNILPFQMFGMFSWLTASWLLWITTATTNNQRGLRKPAPAD